MYQKTGRFRSYLSYSYLNSLLCVNLLASFCAAVAYWQILALPFCATSRSNDDELVSPFALRKDSIENKNEDPVYVWFLPFYDGFLHGLHRRSRGLCLDGWSPNCRGKDAKLALQPHSARNQYIRFHPSGFLELGTLTENHKSRPGKDWTAALSLELSAKIGGRSLRLGQHLFWSFASQNPLLTTPLFMDLDPAKAQPSCWLWSFLCL